MNNNAYLLRDATGQALLIDAAAEPLRLLELIGGTPVVKIVTTHQHPDHWQALAEVKAATGYVYCGAPRGRARHPGANRRARRGR